MSVYCCFFSKMRVALISFLVIWGLGCSLFIDERLQSWKGFHRDELVRTMGPPTEETPISGGGNRIIFVERITRHPTGAQVYGASSVCRMVFETDGEGIIRTVSETGC